MNFLSLESLFIKKTHGLEMKDYYMDEALEMLLNMIMIENEDRLRIHKSLRRKK